MPAKPVPGLGLVIGVVLGYAAMLGASYAMTRLAIVRVQLMNTDLERGAPWLGLLVGIALVSALLMAAPAIGAGAMTGAGAFMTLFGLLFVVLPARQAFDVVKLFRVPGTRQPFSYSLLDGSFLLLGLVLLIVGARRWASDAKVYRLLTAQGQAQDRVYGQTYPAQQQQWGGYPGQQQQPPHPGQQPQHGQTFPGQQQPQHYGQQPPGGHPGQQQPPR